MSLLDPVKPYLRAVEFGVTAVLAASVFVGGCSAGRHMERTSAADKVERAEQTAQFNLDAANACGQALSETSAATHVAEQRAKEWKVAADAADARAAKSAGERDKQTAAAVKALEKARTKPTCAAQLEMELCPGIPLL